MIGCGWPRRLSARHLFRAGSLDGGRVPRAGVGRKRGRRRARLNARARDRRREHPLRYGRRHVSGRCLAGGNVGATSRDSWVRGEGHWCRGRGRGQSVRRACRNSLCLDRGRLAHRHLDGRRRPGFRRGRLPGRNLRRVDARRCCRCCFRGLRRMRARLVHGWRRRELDGGRGRRSGRGRRRRWRCWRRRRHSAWREQRRRIDVSLRIGGDADPEVDVWHLVLGRSARPDSSHESPFPDDLSLAHADAAEMDERHGVAVLRLDRHDLAARAHRAGERHDSAGRCAHRGIALVADVDASMLAARIRVIAEREGFEHLARRRPCPRMCRGWKRGHDNDREDDHERAHRSSFCSLTGQRDYRSASCGRCQFRIRQRDRR